MAERTYTEREIRDILGRAAERQEAARRAADAAGAGLTLEELQAIAAEAGIDPAFVASAASEPAPRAPARTLLGAPTDAARARLLPGPVSDALWAAFVREARETFDRRGLVEQLGDVREWVGTMGEDAGAGGVHLRLEPDPAGTRVSFTQTGHANAVGAMVAGGLSGALAALVVVLTNSQPERWVVVALWLLMALLFVVGTPLVTRAWARRQERRFEALLDRFELLARDAEAAVEPATAAVAPQPALDLDSDFGSDLDAPASSAAGRSRRRTRG